MLTVKFIFILNVNKKNILQEEYSSAVVRLSSSLWFRIDLITNKDIFKLTHTPQLTVKE